MIVIFISSGNRGQRSGSSFSPFSPLPLYFAVLLLRLLLCVFCQVLILFMTLSCVPTVKTPDKTSVSATKSAGSLLHLPPTRDTRAACGSRCAPCSQMCSGGAGLHGLHLQELDFGRHPGMEERILPSSERNCLVTKV